MKQKIFNSNTELCVDIKTILRTDIIARKGKSYQGLFTRNTEEHFTFLETETPKPQKHNPQVFRGEFITITRSEDGNYHPNFRPIQVGPGFNYVSFAGDVANELLWAIEGLVAKG